MSDVAIGILLGLIPPLLLTGWYLWMKWDDIYDWFYLRYLRERKR